MGYNTKIWDSEKREFVEVYVLNEDDEASIGNFYDFLLERKITKMTKKIVKELRKKFKVSELIATTAVKRYLDNELLLPLLRD